MTLRQRDSRSARLLLLLFVAVSGPLLGCRPTLTMDEVAALPGIDETGKIPAQVFLGNPLFSRAELSPSGRRVATIVSRGEVDVIMALDLITRKMTPAGVLERQGVSEAASQRVEQLGWASEDVIVASVSRPLGARWRRTLLVSADTREPRVEFMGEKWKHSPQFQDRIMSWLPDDPDAVLINYFGRARRVDIRHGRLLTEIARRHGIGGWLADHNFDVRIGHNGRSWNNEVEVWGRVDARGKFEELVRWDPLDPEETGLGFHFAGFSEKPEVIYVLSERETGRWALYEFNMKTKSLGREVFAHPKYDVGNIRTSALDGRLLSVSYVGTRHETHYIDRKFERLWKPVLGRFADMDVFVISTDRNERSSIFTVSASNSAPVFHHLDHLTGAISTLFKARPALNEQPLSEIEEVRFASRDGLELTGYVTRPANATGPTAAVVIPGAGVFARHLKAWSPVAQFFASRGFTVFALNTRGSGGYGREQREAGYKQLGLKMQDDVTDGVGWLVESGFADAKRIGVFGIGFSGYSALQGLVATPDLFAAGATYGAITDLDTLLSDDQAYYHSTVENKALIGSRWSDGDYLASVSPARNADKIRSPVLLGHGTEDEYFDIKMIGLMENALEDAGVQHEIYRYQGETHEFIDERARVDFYSKVANFFERHLKPDPRHIRKPVAEE